ncbi:MAG: serine hydroxymethyltransferase [Gammaproteobacteria bacterium]|jgi:glycine hydroxymethyltransferase|nr:serine hydroxymethyltransferase [Gammaproteobacteria bacterium]|tara:strand:- start:967 stop:2223 length:1257 start_codon:yes stop_codon:yes gene_type:complete
MYGNNLSIEAFDKDLWEALESERKRQEQHIELIASENYASPRVMEAQGGILTNKYAEGYPGKRYYGGCEFVDVAEQLAIDRAKKLFKADFANVQPHSGASANAAIFLALLNAGDKILGMSLDHGGHLTHGSKVNFSGKIYESYSYGINPETGDIDYDEVKSLAEEHQPKLIICGFSAFSGILDFKKFREIADSIGAYLLADISHVSGLVAAGLYPNPFPHAHVVSTTTHKTLVGPRGGLILAGKDEELHKKLNSALFPGSQGGPLMHVIAAKAVCFKEAMEPEFVEYQQQILNNAKRMSAALIENDIDVVSNGTSNHMFLVNLVKNKITGKVLDAALGQANITVNKNSVPNDPQSPFVTSGIRIGTPAVTRRGFKENEMNLIASWIKNIIEDVDNEKLINQTKKEVTDLCGQFPVYSE